MSFVMSGNSLAAKAVDIAQRKKTIYGYAMYGFQINDKTIASKALQNLNGWYTTKNVNKLKAVANQQPPVWGFDCVNLIKALLWGWTGDESKEKGGSVYAANGVPDTNADGMIKRCHDVTDDFTSIKVGEVVWMSGHIGIYIGDGLAVECTPKWDDGVQITAVHNIGKKTGFNGRSWEKHGKLPYVSYGDETEAGEEIEIPEDGLGRRLLKRGCTGEDVRELQRLLIQLGFSCGSAGADGEFGKATESAVKNFQTVANIEVDGLFGSETLKALQAALERHDEEEPHVPTYTVTVHGLSKEDAEALCAKWSGAEMAEE